MEVWKEEVGMQEFTRVGLSPPELGHSGVWRSG